MAFSLGGLQAEELEVLVAHVVHAVRHVADDAREALHGGVLVADGALFGLEVCEDAGRDLTGVGGPRALDGVGPLVAVGVLHRLRVERVQVRAGDAVLLADLRDALAPDSDLAIQVGDLLVRGGAELDRVLGEADGAEEVVRDVLHAPTVTRSFSG